MCISKRVMSDRSNSKWRPPYGHRHFEFIIFVHFGQTVYFRWQLATSLQKFIYLRQSVAEILLFVQKSKMAATAILDLIFV